MRIFDETIDDQDVAPIPVVHAHDGPAKKDQWQPVLRDWNVAESGYFSARIWVLMMQTLLPKATMTECRLFWLIRRSSSSERLMSRGKSVA